jgi:hypothetical protein
VFLGPQKPSKGLQKMTAAEHFKIVNDVYTKHRGGQMTTLELAEGLNGMEVESFVLSIFVLSTD